MKARTASFLLALLALAPLALAQGTVPAKVEASTLARQILEYAKHDQQVAWQTARGRDDVLPELRKLTGSLNQQQKTSLLDAVLTLGMDQKQQRWISSTAVVAYLVDVAASEQDQQLRDRAVDLLVQHAPSSLLTIHAARLLQATDQGRIADALLLGKTGTKEALSYLQKGGKLWKINETKARAAAARLGDTAASKTFIEAFQQETDPAKQAALANTLGYIGDAACVWTLAAHMRTPLVYDAGGGQRSLRLDVIAALSEVYPTESVLWPHDVHGNDEIDQWYAAVEKWLEGYLGTKWNTPRPKPFASVPLPTPAR